MLKLTDFSEEHAFEHVKSGCWSLTMFQQWMAAMLAKHNYPINCKPEGHCSLGDNRCVCGGDTAEVQACCANWTVANN